MENSNTYQFQDKEKAELVASELKKIGKEFTLVVEFDAI
jgi:hypothetical protein